jgi:hypothetical protein
MCSPESLNLIHQFVINIHHLHPPPLSGSCAPWTTLGDSVPFLIGLLLVPHASSSSTYEGNPTAAMTEIFRNDGPPALASRCLVGEQISGSGPILSVSDIGACAEVLEG